MQKLNFLLIMMITATLFITSCGNEIESDLCKDVICQNEGSCNEGKCECIAGFEGDNCEINTNKCPKLNPCSNAGKCINRLDLPYVCECLEGYEGDNCEIVHPRAFITTWKTDNEGISDDNQVKIPIITSQDESFNGEVYNYNVDCDNDGVFETENQTGEYTCTYPQAGTYTIAITGEFPKINFTFNKKEDNEKLLSVEQWGTQKWTSMAVAFYNCSNFVLNATDVPNLYSVTDMASMFFGATSFNQDISSWDVSNVTIMALTFFGATSFNQDISSWDVSNVVNLHGMFNNAKSFNQDISLWNVSNTTNMNMMFSYAKSFNQNLSSWDVSNVTDMSYMFYSANSFNQDLSSWDVNNVNSCEDFSKDTNSWILPKPNFTNCTP